MALTIDLLQRALRRKLLDPRSWSRAPLHAHDPALEFGHLDAMADLLWSTTSESGQAA